jgi:hypothetical protein
MMADEPLQNNMTSAREKGEIFLNQWVNSHGDTIVYLLTEELPFFPKYAIFSVPVTETSAEYEGTKPKTPEVLAVGDTEDDIWDKGPFLRARSPENMGYDGLGTFHTNENTSLKKRYDPVNGLF